MQIFHSRQQIESEDELTVAPFFVFIFRVSVPAEPKTQNGKTHAARTHTRRANGSDDDDAITERFYKKHVRLLFRVRRIKVTRKPSIHRTQQQREEKLGIDDDEYGRDTSRIVVLNVVVVAEAKTRATDRHGRARSKTFSRRVYRWILRGVFQHGREQRRVATETVQELARKQ